MREPDKSQPSRPVARTAGLAVAAVLVAIGLWWTWISVRGDQSGRQADLIIMQPEQAAASMGRVPPPLPVGQSPDGTLVSLKLNGVKPADACAALSQQSGLAVQLDRGLASAPPVSVELNRQPFWNAAIAIARQANADIRTSGNTVLICPPYRRITLRPSAVSGPFLIALNSLTQTATADLSGGDSPKREFYATFTLMTEPKVRLLSVSPYAVIAQATDDASNSLLPQRQPALYPRAAEEFTSPVTAVLTYPAKPGRRIVTLKGHAAAYLAGPDQVLELQSPATLSNSVHTLAGIRFTIESLTQSSGNWTLSIWSDMDNARKLWQIVGQMGYARTFALLNDNGKPLPIRDTDRSSDPIGQRMTITHGGAATQPAKLVITVPTDVRQVHIPFEFTNLPMP